jgi:hypothetical protein
VTDDRERTALYRIRGEAGVLLYIGITNSVPFRWNGHQAVQPWWDEVRSLTVEWYGTRTQAEEAEKAAIRAEQPKYNVTYLKPGRSGRSGREQEQPEVRPVGWENITLDPRKDDEDLLNISDVLVMTRQHAPNALRRVLKLTAGPQGFLIGSAHVFRKGEIRRWIAAVEASQKPQAVPVPSAATRKTPRDKKPARTRALPGLEPLFDDVEAS